MSEMEKLIEEFERYACGVVPVKIINQVENAILKSKEAEESKAVVDIAEIDQDIVVGRCPVCDKTIVNRTDDPTRFCKFCGQAVKWSE